MKAKKISTLEAIRVFYIAQELLPEVFVGKRITQKIVENRLKKMIIAAKKIPKEELINYHMDYWNIRYFNYLNAHWELKEVALDECGVWPGMSSLPEEATYGSVVETAKYVRYYIHNKDKLSWDNHRVLYIERVMEYADVISRFVPVVLFEGGVIRNNHNDKTIHKDKLKKLRYDIDDGNNRSVALALLGKKRVLALVGTRIHKSDLFA